MDAKETQDACYMRRKVHRYNSYLQGYPLWDTSRQHWEVSVVAVPHCFWGACC